ncbi:glutamine amidotransferase class-I [Beutenbergia cavernae DSM 12333]|uniref:Glutamine amidotransferase class-I n=1 Tax=Beutenbergia cavernae (strain ATCC BAA-8 / DSM 12333 / CCUG 43141 / JCM 11478 / NBRC 16432 / NCIMB 13614 / HKI 0122) TaxID=471853 RepID=C5BZD3_BEUC1|nr:type 1 glutamine amidotransferase [Beutenbergia cavernae]ACQ79105.1 glutamine amidotransferase class-I [Beutenbergia cavernae DSM 12333]
MSAAPQPPVLTVVQQGPDVGPDLFASWLTGLDLRIVRADLGVPVPAVGAVGDGLLVLGGQMTAFDDDAAPWLPAVRALLVDAAASDVPTLGVCLGAQLLARALGGRVEVAAPHGREAGVVDVRWRPDAADDAVLGPALASVGGGRPPSSSPVLSMHADVVTELPPGAVWLGSSAVYPFQAFRCGSALGVQFHPEASDHTLLHWASGHDDVDVAEVRAQLDERGEHAHALGRALAAAFAAQVRAASDARTCASA